MIRIKKRIKVTGGEAPYTYHWTTDDNCVTFDPQTGTTSTGVIEATLTFDDEQCAPTVELVITSECGNSETFPIDVTLPCDNLVITNITSSRTGNFSVSAAAPGCAKVTFLWEYRSEDWTFLSQADSAFSSTLSLKSTGKLASTPVNVSVIDCNNCTKEATFTFTVQVPKLPDTVVHLYDVGGTYKSGIITLPGFTDIDKGSYNQVLPTGLTYVEISPGVYTYTTLIGTPIQTGTYVAETIDGIPSNNANIIFVIHENVRSSTIQIPNKTINLDCDAAPGDIVGIDITDEVVVTPGYTVDWDSWQLVLPPTPRSSSITLASVGGRHVIQYTVPSPITADAFAFVLCDTEGNCSSSTVYTVLDCPLPPTANDDATTLPSDSSGTVNVLSNDLGNGSPLDPSTVTIVSVDSGITATPNPDGSVTVITSPGVSGNKTFTYKVKNLSGAWSNEATVTVTVISAGTDAAVVLCN